MVAQAATPNSCSYQYTAGTGAYQVDRTYHSCETLAPSAVLAIDITSLTDGNDCTVDIQTLKDITVCNRGSLATVNVDLPVSMDVAPGRHWSYADPVVGFAGVTVITLTNLDAVNSADVCIKLAGLSI